MPEMDGWQVLERLREVSDVPVLMLTARASEPEKVRGLSAGADDYMTKPFGSRELIARVEALLRRVPASGEVLASADGQITLDDMAHRVLVRGEPLDLTPTEFRLLACLLRNARQVVTQEQLLEELWGHRGEPKQLRLYISYVRRKFEPFGFDPIETVRGIGYRLRSPD
jgi:DNA-binding response OmpR family regulator